MQAEVIRSRRKTLCVEIRNGQVIVRAPLRVSGVKAMTLLTRLAISRYPAWFWRMVTGSVLRSLLAQRNTSATVRPPRCAANR